MEPVLDWIRICDLHAEMWINAILLNATGIPDSMRGL